MTLPFDYPATPLVRPHDPRGYERAGSYRAWLRDEFEFRCVFCLVRETWSPADLEVEHFEPVARIPDRATQYGNLLYACRTCNGKTGKRTIPDPAIAFVQGEIAVAANGLLVAKSKRARELVLALGLNTRRQRELRLLWMSVVSLAKKRDPKLYKRLMGYPADLPDLAGLLPPGGNGKPEGVSTSYFTRRERGELQATY